MSDKTTERRVESSNNNKKEVKNKNSFCHETTTKVENGPSVLGFRHREEKKYENYTNNNGDKRTICFIIE
jgi:hypothetical protein